MKKHLIIIFSLIILTNVAFAQIHVTGSNGADGDYTSLTQAGGAFAKINSSAQTGMAIVITVTANSTTEDGATSLNAGAWNSLTIYPAAPGMTISGSTNKPLINLNGADFVTIDGRVNKTGSADLSIINSSTQNAATAITFALSAENNTIEYCNIQGSGTSNSRGIITFTSVSSGNGNDNNLIENNNISGSSAGRPYYAIYSVGTAGRENSGITIRNNNIYDFMNPGNASSGIYLAANNSSCTISGNSIYETTSFATDSTVGYYGIQINSSTGTNFIVDNNFIGGSEAQSLGSAWTKTGKDNAFTGIYINAATGTTSTLNNNIISNISWTNDAGANFTGVYVAGGDVNVISSTISSITVGSTTSTALQSVYGIYNTSAGNIRISDNVIANLTNGTANTNTSTRGVINGITSSNGTDRILNNSIHDLSIANANTSATNSASVTGIALTAATRKTVSGNIINNLSNTYASFAGSVTGIYFTAISGATPSDTVSRNFIFNLTVPGSLSAATLNGIRIASGSTIYANNIISLGGNTASTIYGIYEAGALSNNNYLYYNTVSVCGNPTTGNKSSFALFSNGSANTRDFRNNVLSNTRSNNGATGPHYAIRIATPTNLTLDYNDYWVSGTGGVLGSVNGVGNIFVLPIAPGTDAASLTDLPLFSQPCGNAALNFVPSDSSLIATPVSITEDYNTGARDGVSPSMGAFEIKTVKASVSVYKANVFQKAYLRLKDAFDAFNSGVHNTGSFEIRINKSINEPASARLNASGTGSANYASILIFPTTSGIVISGNMDAPLIDLFGADNVTINGSPGALGNTKNMIITNTSRGTVSETSTIRWINGANNNVVKNCILKGSSKLATTGTLLFSSSTGSTGNNGNRIENNDITCSDIAYKPLNVIYSKGSASLANSTDTIKGNNIYDNLNKALASNIIFLDTLNSGWSISGNHLYETTTIIPTVSVAYYAIRVSNSGNNYNISDNFIGGTAPNCGGTPWTKTNAFNNIFTAIYLSSGAGTSSSIQNNTIRNFDWSNSLNGTWTGIQTAGAGPVNIGTVTGNTIGSATGTGSVLITCASNANSVYGINIGGTGSTDCQKNTIGSITVANAAANGSNFYGIAKSVAAGTTTISNNIIGSTTTASSINTSSQSTGSAQYLYGIYNLGTGTITINNNKVANLNNGTTNPSTTITGKINGIYTSGGTATISGNEVFNLSIGNANNASTVNASICGIALSGPTLKTVTGNRIHHLANTNASYTGSVIGMYVTVSTGANKISENLIHSLSVSSSSAFIFGIKMNSGACTYSNNIITISGNTATTIYGIFENGASGNNNNLYFNTVSICGSPTSGALPSYALYNNANTNTRNFRNNIFVNTRSNSGASGKNYAIYLSGKTNLTIDYNNYFVSGSGTILGYLAADIASLPAWKIATGQDANSASQDPVFVNNCGTAATDYIPSNCVFGATNTGITTDFNQVTRSNQPTIGAWEGTCNKWKGATSTDWNTASNWTGNSVPAEDANIAFDSAPLNNCVLDANHSVNNILNATSFRMVTNGKRLTIKGDLLFSGGAQIDASSNSSNIEYKGALAQTIPAGAFYNDQIYNLTVNDSNNVTLNGTLYLLNTITATKGLLDASTTSPTVTYGGTIAQTIQPGIFLSDKVYNFTVDNGVGVLLNTFFTIENNLTINPAKIFTINPPGKATINAIINNGTINLNSTSATDIFSMMMNSYTGSGIANVQLFLTGGGSPNYNWHYVTVPLDGLPVTYFTNINALNLLAYNDSRVVTSDFNGWSWWDGYGGTPGIAAGGGFSTLSYGKGYNFYNTADATVNFTGMTSLGTTLGSVSLQYSGTTPNNSIFGLNLLGNSLTCSLDWTKVILNGPVSSTVHYTTGNQWASYNPNVGGTNGATKDIPPLQGFFVQATDRGASIDLSGAKEHSTQARYKKSGTVNGNLQNESETPQVKLELNGADGTSDETIVWFNDKATTGYDSEYDGSKLFNSEAPFGELFSIIGGVNYVINGIPLPKETYIVPLGVKIARTGNYSFIKKKFIIPTGYQVYLIDKDRNSLTLDLKNNKDYTFSSNAGTFKDRFLLKITSLSKNQSEQILSDANFDIYASFGIVNVTPLNSTLNSEIGEVKIYDLTGRIVKHVKNIEWHEGSPVQIPCKGQQGVFIVEITSGAVRQTGKIYLQ